MLCVFIRHPARAVEVLYISVCSSTISCDMNLLPSDYWSAPKVVNCNQLVLFTKSICSLHENICSMLFEMLNYYFPCLCAALFFGIFAN
jgi:uncharacterized protein involved in tolerance to divalent cations